jgi:putative FmdB family regulatory protein
MPIYEYECNGCGHHMEAIQKFSDKPLRKCPACGKQRLKKLVSAAAFHLKGTGWYATDFKDKPKSAKSGGDKAEASSSGDKSETKKESKSESSTDTATKSKPAASAG